ncbi:hypothetical protein CR513_44347, partial [Mucuna pruriens]
MQFFWLPQGICGKIDQTCRHVILAKALGLETHNWSIYCFWKTHLASNSITNYTLGVRPPTHEVWTLVKGKHIFLFAPKWPMCILLIYFSRFQTCGVKMFGIRIGFKAFSYHK